jgi:Sec-independent protein secretion pathway component TatC
MTMGISPLGWLHTLGSFPAIPLAAYMLVRHGRITPETRAGRAYFWFMSLGALTVYPIAHQPISSIIATVTLVVLFLGYGISRWPMAKRLGKYVETISLSLSVFLLMVPTVSESLRRLPVGHPLVTDMNDPLLLGALGTIFLALIVGTPLQLRALYKRETVSGKAAC